MNCEYFQFICCVHLNIKNLSSKLISSMGSIIFSHIEKEIIQKNSNPKKMKRKNYKFLINIEFNLISLLIILLNSNKNCGSPSLPRYYLLATATIQFVGKANKGVTHSIQDLVFIFVLFFGFCLHFLSFLPRCSFLSHSFEVKIVQLDE